MTFIGLRYIAVAFRSLLNEKGLYPQAFTWYLLSLESIKKEPFISLVVVILESLICAFAIGKEVFLSYR